MNGSILLDTNLLVYAYDRTEPVKQARALEVLDGLATSALGLISSQVLAEFFVVMTRKMAEPLPIPVAAERIESFLRIWPVLPMTGMVVLEATRGVRDHQFSYWDAQIWATARLNQIPTVFSEDFNAGAFIEGVRFVNPFASDFEPMRWAR